MLSQEQIDFFHRNGFLIMRRMFQGEELRLLQEAVDSVQAEGVAKQGSDHLYAPGPEGEPVYWRSERMWSRAEIFRAVTVQPDLLEAIGQCVGQPFFPWNDSLVVKLANSGAEVTWHQDPPYGTQWGDRSRTETYPVPNFTTDIYLDRSAPDNGCVWAIPGRHLVGHIDLSRKTSEQLFTECGAQPLEMEAGDVLFHALSTPHGSRANLSATQRRIFYIHYLAHEVFAEGYESTGADWVTRKPGWGSARDSVIQTMFEARRKFGWEGAEARDTLKYGEGGFLFQGEPASPPRYWETLRKQMSAEEYARLRDLS